MVQIDIPVAFGTGSLFAAAVEKGLRSEQYAYFYHRALTANLIFQLLLVIWLPVYLLIAHFGFQTSHMWWTGTSITDYPWLLPVFLVAYFVANIAGFHVGARLVINGRSRGPWLLFAGGFVFFGCWMAFQPYRTLTLGTYAEWEARAARRRSSRRCGSWRGAARSARPGRARSRGRGRARRAHAGRPRPSGSARRRRSGR